MNKKLFTLGIALVLTLSLAACGEAVTETTIPSGSTTPSTTAPAETTKPQETTQPETTGPAVTDSIPAETESTPVNP